ncbi:GAF domain-containing protein [Streptomyces sp. NPDC056672]|uniref:GAF domain-containing protein n=1 Tax=Streptomyces sp. NPDC056672 TaxID=3345906 RepID=UPI0036D0FACF
MAELGLTEVPVPEFDALATRLAEDAQVAYAMVNLVSLGGRRQYFTGLHCPDGQGELPAVGRTMDMDAGFCTELLKRKHPLPLHDVYAAPRYASNPVVDQIGARTYAGAQLIDHESGVTLGTVCYVGTERRDEKTNHAALALIKTYRDEVMHLIHERAARITQ